MPLHDRRKHRHGAADHAALDGGHPHAPLGDEHAAPHAEAAELAPVEHGHASR
jgi:hypothetical protein